MHTIMLLLPPELLPQEHLMHSPALAQVICLASPVLFIHPFTTHIYTYQTYPVITDALEHSGGLNGHGRQWHLLQQSFVITSERLLGAVNSPYSAR
jgi:hypothetical protein